MVTLFSVQRFRSDVKEIDDKLVKNYEAGKSVGFLTGLIVGVVVSVSVIYVWRR
jgi:hypothetical protein